MEKKTDLVDWRYSGYCQSLRIGNDRYDQNATLAEDDA